MTTLVESLKRSLSSVTIHQKYLQTLNRPKSTALMTGTDMLEYLTDIQKNHFRVQNAYREYQRPSMENPGSFTGVYTRFLHLVGKDHILDEDIRPHLYGDMTLN